MLLCFKKNNTLSVYTLSFSIFKIHVNVHVEETNYLFFLVVKLCEGIHHNVHVFGTYCQQQLFFVLTLLKVLQSFI